MSIVAVLELSALLSKRKVFHTSLVAEVVVALPAAASIALVPPSGPSQPPSSPPLYPKPFGAPYPTQPITRLSPSKLTHYAVSQSMHKTMPRIADYQYGSSTGKHIPRFNAQASHMIFWAADARGGMWSVWGFSCARA